LSSFSNNSNNFDQSAISFELIDKCILDLKLGKASGPDELMAEHLKYAHTILKYIIYIFYLDQYQYTVLFQVILASGLLSP